MARDDEDQTRADRFLGQYGGFLVAGIGFSITRFFVAETVTLSDAPIVVLATAGSLIVGLGLAVAGVALAVGAFDPEYVADVSYGCVLGTAAIAVAAIVTIAATGMRVIGTGGSTQLLLANALLAGAIGGMVNGHRKASLRSRQETIMRGANRARFINRLLRHEVLNAATIVDGHAELLRSPETDRDRSVDAIRRSAARIESTVNGVGTIADQRKDGATGVADAVRSAIESTEDTAATAEADIVVPDDIDDGVTVAADDRLSVAVERLIGHAIDVRGADEVTVAPSVERHSVTIVVADDGEPLSDKQQSVLERGVFPEYDDPKSGFALQAVNLLVGEYDGTITVDRNGDGESETRVGIRIPRADVDTATATVGVPSDDLVRASAAGVGAGLIMGGVYWLTSGVLPVIGALYGVESAAVGWITHLFHSVVFAMLFVTIVSSSRLSTRVKGILSAAAAGLGWGAALWLIAAGLVMPLWLRGVGVPAPFPNLPAIGLLAHGVWGVTLGLGYAALDGRFG